MIRAWSVSAELKVCSGCLRWACTLAEALRVPLLCALKGSAYYCHKVAVILALSALSGYGLSAVGWDKTLSLARGSGFVT